MTIVTWGKAFKKAIDHRIPTTLQSAKINCGDTESRLVARMEDVAPVAQLREHLCSVLEALGLSPDSAYRTECGGKHL